MRPSILIRTLRVSHLRGSGLPAPRITALHAAARDAAPQQPASEKGGRLPGGIYLVPTPIGNLEDITLRALRVLRSAELILCEDTRRTRQLLNYFEVAGGARLASFHQHNEWRKQDSVLDQAQRGVAVAVVSDAGLPGINDPGAALVAAAVERGVGVTVLPGASAVLTAAVASGLPLARFIFCGFTAPKPGARRKQFEGVRGLAATLIFFVSPHGVVRALEDAAAVLGADRRCCLARELTKAHEELYRDTLGGALAEFSSREPRGEFTLVIEGARDPNDERLPGEVDDTELLQALREAVGTGQSPTQAAKSVAAALGVSRKHAYSLLAADSSAARVDPETT